MTGVEPPTPRERLNDRVVRSRYVICADGVIGVPRVMLPVEMARWLSSSEYREDKLSYPDYCKFKCYKVELGPGATLVSGRVKKYVKNER